MDIIKGKVRWVDIVNPGSQDIKWIRDTYGFHQVIIEELKGPSARAKVEFYGTYLYFIYYFPIFDEKERVSRRSEIDFLITKKDVITVRYEEITVLEELKRTLNPENRAMESTMRLLHVILETLLAFQNRQLNHIREKVEEISAEIFKDRERQRERELLAKISYVKRDISQYRLIVKPQKHTLESLSGIGCGFLGQDCQVYLGDLMGEHLKVIDQLEDYRQAVDDFETTNNQLINIKTTEVAKTFTIMAFLTFPLMLFAALFSMNTKNTPLVGHPNDFWIILSLMITAMAGMFAYFRSKDWI